MVCNGKVIYCCKTAFLVIVCIPVYDVAPELNFIVPWIGIKSTLSKYLIAQRFHISIFTVSVIRINDGIDVFAFLNNFAELHVYLFRRRMLLCVCKFFGHLHALCILLLFLR